MRPLFLLALCFKVACCSGQDFSISLLGFKPPLLSNCTSVKDQNLSSTCWSFSSNSFLESELIRSGKGKMDLSEMFVARYSLVRKIQRHLQLKGQNFFTPGGQFHDEVWVMQHYGMVPEEVYSGKGRGEHYHNHAELDTLLSHFVRKCVSSGLTRLNGQQQAFVDSVLDHYLGPVPVSFFYKGKKFTPQSFLRDYLGINPGDYAEITSYTHHPFYKPFVLEDKYNWTSDEYWNVPLGDFSRITDSALKNGFTVGWDGDASDDYFRFADGMAWLPGPTRDFQQARQNDFEDHRTELDHMMHIVGVSTDRFGKKWYYIKNSWGDYSNSLGGFLFMREDYFLVRTVAIIVNKKAVPPDIRRKLEW